MHRQMMEGKSRTLFSVLLTLFLLTTLLILPLLFINTRLILPMFTSDAPSQQTNLSLHQYSSRKLSLNKTLPFEPFLEEYNHPLSCVDEFLRVIEEKPMEQPMKDLAKLYIRTLNELGREKFFKSRPREDVIKSKEVVVDRLAAYQQCPPGVKLPTLAICSVQKGSGPFVQEWISYYLIHGVQKIVFYDNSVPGTPELERFRQAVRPFVESGHVMVKDWFTKNYRQKIAFNDCFIELRKSFEWIAFLDVDEYLVVKAPLPPCIPEFLTLYEEYPALHVKWRVFTPIGVSRHNFSQLFLEQYRWFKTKDKEVRGKTIIQTKYSFEMHVHGGQHKFGFANFNSHGEEGYWDESENPYEHVELRHYWGMDWEFAMFDKVCGKTKERAEYFNIRANTLLNFFDAVCCNQTKSRTRQETPLRKFYFGEEHS